MEDVGTQIFDNLVDLEKKFWNREDYSEDDITTFSDTMDFIEEYLEEFKEYFKDRTKE